MKIRVNSIESTDPLGRYTYQKKYYKIPFASYGTFLFAQEKQAKKYNVQIHKEVNELAEELKLIYSQLINWHCSNRYSDWTDQNYTWEKLKEAGNTFDRMTSKIYNGWHHPLTFLLNVTYNLNIAISVLDSYFKYAGTRAIARRCEMIEHEIKQTGRKYASLELVFVKGNPQIIKIQKDDGNR